ncbi:MAG: hypothetical protein IKC75_05640 [Clostridia bacterium]|nr:hypothetical protein [Clostridia bacterium]
MAILILEILISFLAVFGLYAAVRFFCAYALSPKGLAVALRVSKPVSAEEAAFLYCRAKNFAPGFVPCKIIVCIRGDLEGREEVKSHFLRLGADCIMENTEGGG